MNHYVKVSEQVADYPLQLATQKALQERKWVLVDVPYLSTDKQVDMVDNTQKSIGWVGLSDGYHAEWQYPASIIERTTPGPLFRGQNLRNSQFRGLAVKCAYEAGRYDDASTWPEEEWAAFEIDPTPEYWGSSRVEFHSVSVNNAPAALSIQRGGAPRNGDFFRWYGGRVTDCREHVLCNSTQGRQMVLQDIIWKNVEAVLTGKGQFSGEVRGSGNEIGWLYRGPGSGNAGPIIWKVRNEEQYGLFDFTSNSSEEMNFLLMGSQIQLDHNKAFQERGRLPPGAIIRGRNNTMIRFLGGKVYNGVCSVDCPNVTWQDWPEGYGLIGRPGETGGSFPVYEKGEGHLSVCEEVDGILQMTFKHQADVDHPSVLWMTQPGALVRNFHGGDLFTIETREGATLTARRLNGNGGLPTRFHFIPPTAIWPKALGDFK